MDAVSVGKLLGRCGEFYWSPHGFRNRERFTALAADPWREALANFLAEFAFERQGASRDYSPAAVTAIRQHAGEMPDQRLEHNAWREFCRQLDKDESGGGLNPSHQPLNPSEEGKLSIVALVANLSDYEHNIMRWARERICAGELRACWLDLQRVRGIATKIAAFYLRDVITAHGFDESRLEPICFQPIDIWTRRGAQALAPLVDRRAPRDEGDEAAAAEVLVETARRADISPSLINAGLWVFGAAVLGSNISFTETLTDDQAFKSAVRNASARLRTQRERYDGLVGLADELADR